MAVFKVVLFVCLILVIAWTVRAESPTMPAYVSPAGEYEVDYMIGGDIEDEGPFLFQIRALALDSKGNLFVLDPKSYCVKKYDPAGNYLLSFGTQGEGPGEMLQGLFMAITPDDHIDVYDINLRRFVAFDALGNHIQTATLTELGTRFPDKLAFGTDGSLYVRIRDTNYVDMSAPAKMSVCGMSLESFEEKEIYSAFVKDRYLRFQDGGITSISAPVPPELCLATSRFGHLIVCNSGDYTIRQFSFDGELLAEQSHKTKRRPYTDAEKREYIEHFEESKVAGQMAREDVEYPDYKPFFADMFVDSDGYLLFQLYGEDDEAEESTFDVFTGDLQFVGQATMPTLRSSALLADGFIYNVGLYEEESFVVYRYRPVSSDPTP